MDKQLSTKEMIIYVALDLISIDGYEGVSVRDIAKRVGVRESALYKHYKNKQDIFNSCVKVFGERMEGVRRQLMLPGTGETFVDYKDMNEEMLVRNVQRLFLFYLRDEVASKFRRILMMERYRNNDAEELYQSIFVDGAINYEKAVFEKLMEIGVLKMQDAYIMAVDFYSPILFLLQKYDNKEAQDKEALEEIRNHIVNFINCYKI